MNPRLRVHLTMDSNPLEIFTCFFPNELLQLIVTETNAYARDHPPPPLQLGKQHHDIAWKDCTVNEVTVVLAMCILMGIVKKSTFDSYWTRDDVIETPFFSKTIPGDRLRQIMSNLHFCDNTNPDENDRLFKIRRVLEICRNKFTSAYQPTQDIAIDESLMKFHDRLHFKQFNPTKRARFGIKVYKLCQSAGSGTGYIWNFKIYTGEDNTNDDPAGTKVVLGMIDSLLDKGYNVYLDNWYSSPDLYIRLLNRSTNSCGTVRLNRRNMPAVPNERKNMGDVFCMVMCREYSISYLDR